MSTNPIYRFGDRPPDIPKPKNLKSWWANPTAQEDRRIFTALARAEHDRIVGNQTFGGSKRVFDKFPQSPKK